MKYLLLLLGIFPFSCFSQNEFESNSPFMYDSTTMIQLKGIVDSLNLRFQQCDLDRDFHSKKQAHGWRVLLNGKGSMELNLALASSPNIEEIKQKFPEATFIPSLFVHYEYVNYDEKERIEVYAYPGDVSKEFENSPKRRKQLEKGKWLSDYSDYKNGSTTAFYFEEDFQTTKIPDNYGKMIQYVDCMIDTNSFVMKEDLKSGNYQPLPDNYRDLSLREKKELLEERRNKHVMGFCSQDQSPRNHARDIAILSAEALEWEIFLRAHLNVMNDRFDRMSDGSYAWAGRGTYISELEEIDLDILSLMVGISLRMDDPANNHYNGSIPRIGRAIAESRELEKFHELFAFMMRDDGLDDYNKILIYYLLLNSNSYATPENRDIHETKLQEAVQGLPEFFRKSVTEK